MTKGANFQARIDLTNQRREAAKALKAAKAAGLVIEPDALMTKILLLDPGVDLRKRRSNIHKQIWDSLKRYAFIFTKPT